MEAEIFVEAHDTKPNSDKRPPLPPLTGARAVAQVIARMDRPVVYGMPGGYTMQIYDALYDLQDRVSTYLVREECLATVMAEAHGRLTGRPAVVMAQGAWVLGNAGIGIMEAHLGCSPMVILIDATDGGAYSHLGPYQGGIGGYGAYDLPAAMSAITKRTFVAYDATQALQMTQLAIKHAMTGELGPVAVIFHGRSLFGHLDAAKEPPSYLDRSYGGPLRVKAAQSELDSAAALISSARRPVIISGNGVRLGKAEAALQAFAGKFGIPVATTPAGKGTFPEDNPLALGIIGSFGHETANLGVGASDLIIAVGTKLGATDTANAHPDLINPARQRLVQIDIEPLNLAWTFPVDLSVLGDAADTLTRLLPTLQGYDGQGAERVATLRGSNTYFDRSFTSGPTAFSARDAVAILSQEMPADVVATCDAGENRLFMLKDFQSKTGGTVLQPNGGGGMGYAVPAAMAAALNFPGRPALAVCGDGGFSMSLHGLMSAIDLGLTLTVVVLDNQVLGWVYNGQRGRLIASELKSFDYASIAKSMGCFSATAHDTESFRAAVIEARSRKGVSVIVAHTGQQDRYQDVMSSLQTVDIYAVPPQEPVINR